MAAATSKASATPRQEQISSEPSHHSFILGWGGVGQGRGLKDVGVMFYNTFFFTVLVPIALIKKIISISRSRHVRLGQGVEAIANATPVPAVTG